MSDWQIVYNDGRNDLTVSNVTTLNLVNGAFVFDAADSSTGAIYTSHVEPGDLIQSVIRTDPVPVSASHSIDVWWRALPISGGLISGSPDRLVAAGAWPVDDTWLALFDDLGAVRYIRLSLLRSLKLV